MSKRAHSPRRLGTISSRRPSGASTRHISRSIGPVRSATSRQCTHSSRSTEAVRQRQHHLVHQHREHVARLRPHQRALVGGHQRRQPGRLVAEHADVGHGKAQAHQLAAARVAPARADALRQQPAHDAAERPVVEVAKSDNVVLHEESRATLRGRFELEQCGCQGVA